MKKYIYIRTDCTKYDLPIAIADSAKELAKMLGTTSKCVSSSISHRRKGWYKVESEET